MSAEQPTVIEVTIAAPVEAVWRSLRDPDLIRAWHGWHYDGLDEEVATIFVEHATADDDARVLRVGDEDVFTCEPVDGGTRVRITRPAYRPGEQWSDYYDEVTEGWRTFLQQLRFLHELHPDEPRRTIALMGQGPVAGIGWLWANVPSPLGPDRFRSELQRGALLPELGPGLVIVATKPVDDAETSAMVVVTTYGLSDPAFEDQRQSWTRWWRSVFPDAEDAQV